MDGVPYVSQCPILPRQKFTYRFMAYPVGTHWYHSHFSTQRLDGISGAFIVHKKQFEGLKPQPEYILSVSDWHPHEGHTLEITSPFRKEAGEVGTGELYFLNHRDREYSADGVEATAIRFFSGLINGRGRTGGSSFPLEYFPVENGTTYRMRTLNTGAEYAFSISVDNHHLRVIALDGFEVDPINADEFILFPGERIDFELTATLPLNKKIYWIRAQSLRIGKGRFAVPDPVEDGQIYEACAILTYDKYKSTRDRDPSTHKKRCTASDPCTVFNCPAPYFPRHMNKRCISLEATKSVQHSIDSNTQGHTNSEELFFNIGFIGGSHINGYRFTEPSAPLFQSDNGVVSCSKACKTHSRRNCPCTHQVKLKFNQTYHIILTNIQQNALYVGHHPVHIHGHSFEVLKVGYPVVNSTTGRILRVNPDVRCLDETCTRARWADESRPKLNLGHPPWKDTVVVPAMGYVILRLKTNNPGLWMMHCHSDMHNLEGMALLFDGKWYIRCRKFCHF